MGNTGIETIADVYAPIEWTVQATKTGTKSSANVYVLTCATIDAVFLMGGGTKNYVIVSQTIPKTTKTGFKYISNYNFWYTLL